MLRPIVLALLLIGGCYSPDLAGRCKISCSDEASCPAGMRCTDKVCRSDTNDTCPPVDAGPGVAGRKFLEISAGEHHACAIDVDHVLVCWGGNEFGQLTGVRGPSQTVGIEIAPPPGSTWYHVSAGEFHTCAIAADANGGREVLCWGSNAFNQAGGNDVESVAVTTVSLGTRTPEEVSAGLDHTCVTTATDGEILCWGQNDAGQLGHVGFAGPVPSVPVDKVDGAGWVHVSAGGKTTCATTDDGHAHCWGSGDTGQLGNGMTVAGATTMPQTLMLDPQSVQAIAVGFRHVCALGTEGDPGFIRCWGEDMIAQVGTHSLSGGSAQLVPAHPNGRDGGSAGWRSIDAGRVASCGSFEGRVYCWGLKGSVVLGDDCQLATCRTDGGPDSIRPVATLSPLVELTNAFAVTVGGEFGCALFGDDPAAGGVARCWGANDFGQLGNGESSSIDTATKVTDDLWRVVRFGRDFGCGIKMDGTVWCWGQNNANQASENEVVFEAEPQQRADVTGAIDLALGDDHACALVKASGVDAVKCWGSNLANELGAPGDSSVKTPMLAGNPMWVGISAGGNTTCVEAIPSMSTMCWGSLPSWAFPMPMTTPRTLANGEVLGSAIRLGLDAVCSRIDSKLQCNGEPAIRGDGVGTVDQKMVSVVSFDGSPSDVVDHSELAAGGSHRCAALLDGTVACWGNNGRHQAAMLMSFLLEARTRNLLIDAGPLAPGDRRLATGAEFSCAIANTQKVECWGDNNAMQCTSAGGEQLELPTGQSAPIATEGTGNYHSIAAGAASACGIQLDNKLYCWGSSRLGQTGTGASDKNHYEAVLTAP